MNYEWKKNEYGQVLEWQDFVDEGVKRLQQIYLEPRPGYCDRGRFVAKYDTIDGLSRHLDRLNNYYFAELIAKVECQNWAKLISKTISDRLIDAKIARSGVVHDRPYYQTKLSTVLLVFESGLEENVTRFDALSKDQEICTIDFADFFPRYYTVPVNAICEEQAWHDVWCEKHFNSN